MSRARVFVECYHCWCGAVAASYDILFFYGWAVVPVFGEDVWLCPICQIEGV